MHGESLRVSDDWLIAKASWEALANFTPACLNELNLKPLRLLIVLWPAYSHLTCMSLVGQRNKLVLNKNSIKTLSYLMGQYQYLTSSSHLSVNDIQGHCTVFHIQ